MPVIVVLDRARDTVEARATYRKWILGLVVFYSALLLFSGAVAIVIDASRDPVASRRLDDLLREAQITIEPVK